MNTVMQIIVSGEKEHVHKMKKALQAITDGNFVYVYDENDDSDVHLIDAITDDTNVVRVSLLDKEKQVGQHDEGIWVFSDTPAPDVLRLCCSFVTRNLKKNLDYLQMLYETKY